METIDGIIKFVAGNINGDNADNAIGAATGSTSATGDVNFWLIACLAIGVVAIGAVSYVLCHKWATSRGTHAKSFNNTKFFSIFLAIIVSIALAGSFASTKFKAMAESNMFSMDPVIGTVNTDGIVYSESKISNNTDDDLYIEKLILTKSAGIDDKDCTWTIKSGDIVMFQGQANGEDVTEIDTLTVNANDSVPLTVTTEGLAPEDAAKIIGFEIAIQVRQQAEIASAAKEGAGDSVEEAANEANTSIDNDASLTDTQKTEYKEEIAAAQVNTTDEIIAAKNKKEVNEAVESGEKAINEIAKAAAKASLENYATAKKAEIDTITGISDDEKTAAKNEIDQALAAGKTAVDETSTQEEVNAAVGAAKAKMDATAAKISLLSKYNEYANEISNLKTLTDAKKAEYLKKLKAAYDEGYEAIGNATTSEQVTALYTKYLDDLKKIYNDAVADKTTTTITLNANGGADGKTTSVTATYGVAMTAITGEGALPTKTGYTFTGFYDASTGGTPYYNANGTSAKDWDKTDANSKLYAHWQINQYTVTFQADSTGYGTVSTTSKTVDYGTAFDGSAAAFSLDGATASTATPSTKTSQYTYSFTKWTDKDGATVTSGNITGDVTYTANFTRTINQYTVSFVSNNTDYGTVSVASKEVDYGTSFDGSGAEFKLGGTAASKATATSSTAQYTYAFSNWTSSGSAVTTGTITGATTFTANFTQTLNKYTVSFVSNNTSYGTVSVASKEVDYGTSFDGSGAEFKLGGTAATKATATSSTAQYTYAFSNWTSSGSAVTTGTITGDVTFTANFTRTENKIKVTFQSNDTSYGAADPTSIDVDPGTNYSVDSTASNKLVFGTGTEAQTVEAKAEDGYGFDSWSSTSGTITSETTITVTFSVRYKVTIQNESSATLTSQWITSFPADSTFICDCYSSPGMMLHINGEECIMAKSYDVYAYVSTDNGSTWTDITFTEVTVTGDAVVKFVDG